MEESEKEGYEEWGVRRYLPGEYRDADLVFEICVCAGDAFEMAEWGFPLVCCTQKRCRLLILPLLCSSLGFWWSFCRGCRKIMGSIINVCRYIPRKPYLDLL